MLFAKDNSPSEIAGAAAMGESRVTAREREHRPIVIHCGRHKIVIIAAGTIRPISFATASWKQEPFVESYWARRVRRSTLREVADRCVLNRVTEIACEFIAS